MMRRLLVVMVAAVLAVIGGAGSTAAHTELIASDPLPGGTVGELDQISLIFAGEFLVEEGVTVTLERRSDQQLIELGEPRTPTASAIEVDVVGELLGDDEYVVRYESTAADDGVRQQGAFAFVYDSSLAPDTGVDAVAVGALVVGGLALASLVWIVARGRDDDGVADDAVEFDPHAAALDPEFDPESALDDDFAESGLDVDADASGGTGEHGAEFEAGTA